MRITREVFREIYAKYPHILELEEWLFTKPKTDVEFVERLSSKLWRLCNIYTVANKEGQLCVFDMNYPQHVVYAAQQEHPRDIILKSRQVGISTWWLVNFFDDAIFNEHQNFGLMAQGLDESTKLLDRINLLWDRLCPEIKKFACVDLDKDNAKEWRLTNSSVIFIRTSFRSTTLQGLHISEYGKIANTNPKKAKEVNTGTLQAIAQGRPVAIESTAEGDNDFKFKWDKAIERLEKGLELSPKDFYPVFIPWYKDPDCNSDIMRYPSTSQQAYFDELDKLGIKLTQSQKNFWLMQYDELIDEGDANAIHQEYPATPEEAFQKSRDGTFYAQQFRARVTQKGRMINDLYDPNLDVEAVFDLGMNDTNFITFWQEGHDGHRCIDEYAQVGMDIEHYVDYMRELPYEITRIVLPHDAAQRELTSGMTREDKFYELGCRNIDVLPKLPFAEGVDAVRRLIKDMFIDPKCSNLIDCINNYSKKWDENNKTWHSYTHVHNKYSNGADSLRYAALSRAIFRREERADKQRGFTREYVDRKPESLVDYI